MRTLAAAYVNGLGIFFLVSYSASCFAQSVIPTSGATQFRSIIESDAIQLPNQIYQARPNMVTGPRFDLELPDGLSCSCSSGTTPAVNNHGGSTVFWCAFSENNITKPISLDEVCAECSLSARSLQAAFKEVKHLSPLKHLQVMRLKRMRETIQRGFDVSEACARSGLSFSGRTSSLYRELFAESPSETRRLSRQRRP